MMEAPFLTWPYTYAAVYGWFLLLQVGGRAGGRAGGGR